MAWQAMAAVTAFWCPNCEQYVRTRRARSLWYWLLILPALVGLGIVVGYALSGALSSDQLSSLTVCHAPNGGFSLGAPNPSLPIPMGTSCLSGSAVSAAMVAAVVFVIAVAIGLLSRRCRRCGTKDVAAGHPLTPSSPAPPMLVQPIQGRRGRTVAGGLGLLATLSAVGVGVAAATWVTDTCTEYVGSFAVNMTLQGWGSSAACQQSEGSTINRLASGLAVLTLGRISGNLHSGSPSGAIICEGWTGLVHYTVRDSTGLFSHFHILAKSWCSELAKPP